MGFRDVETARGTLKHTAYSEIVRREPDPVKREEISAFYRALTHYLADTVLPPRDRAILELYAEGVYVKQICARLACSDKTVRNTIGRHKAKLLARRIPPLDRDK